ATDTATATPITITGGNSAVANMNLQPGGGIIMGRVTRSDNGNGVGGITVNASGLSPRGFIFGFGDSAVTADNPNNSTDPTNGNFTIRGLPAGQYVLQGFGFQTPGGTAEGFHIGAVPYDPNRMVTFNVAVPVTVTNPGTTGNINFVLPAFTSPDAPRTISGTVRDGNGNPVPFAVVQARDPFTFGTVRGASTNSNGTYTINLLPPGKYIVVAFAESTYQTVTYPGQRLQSSGTAVDVTASCSSTPCPTGIDLTLPSPAGMITGTVRSDTGQPIVGAN